MKFDVKQNRLFLLTAALLVVAIALCGAFSLWRQPSPSPAQSGAAATPTPDVAEAPIQEPSTDGGTATSGGAVLPSSKSVKTTVYYQDNYGYLVRVSRSVPDAQGIAKATLALMVSSAYNDMEAARLGLRTVLPENTTIDLDISSEGAARIDLGKEVLKLEGAEAESAMVSAVVQTLTEFPSVKTVRFLIDHQERDALPNGTSISGEFTRGALNLESANTALAPDQAKTVQLYFPGESSSLIVPVTRTVYGSDDIHTAVLELAKGPSAQSPLDSALPAGCGLIGVDVKDGIATINFTREFIQIAEESDGGRAALKALVLTCTRFQDVNSVQIQVEGEPYDPGASTLAVPTFINDASSMAEEYIRTQSAMLIDTGDAVN